MKHSHRSPFKFTLIQFAFVAVVATVFAFLAVGNSKTSAAPSPQFPENRVTCASNDMRRHSCPADTRGGVRLIKQRSEAKCILNQTWGFDVNSIWVDRGCRAEFDLGGAAQAAQFNREDTYSVYCASDAMERVWCPADARFGVQLLKQRSEAECLQNETWGSGKRGIWVDHGCRADFVVAGDWKNRAAGFVYCASDDYRRAFCNVDTRDGIFIVRQRSGADCVFNRTWGYDREHIWVDQGCRADFEVVDYRQAEWRNWDYRRDADQARDRDGDRDRDRDGDRNRDRDRDSRSDDRRDGDDHPRYDRDRDRDDHPPYDRPDDRPPQQ